MTTNTTPDDFTDASWLGALTSHTWLGDLADELGPELAQEFTDNRRCYYEHGHARLRMPAGDLDGATTTLRALVAVIDNRGGCRRLIRARLPGGCRRRARPPR